MSRFLKHSAVWLVFILYILLEDINKVDYNTKFILINLDYVVAHMVCFYFLYFLVWRYTSPFKPAFLIPGVLIGMLSFSASRYLLDEVVVRAIFGAGNYNDPKLGFYISDNSWRTLLTSFVSLGVFQIEMNSKQLALGEKLKKEKQEAELAFLRTQLNPHFLFNALNYIYSRSLKSDPELSESVLELSNVLRSSLENAQKESYPVSEECKLISNYLSLQKKRFGDEIHIDWQFDIDKDLQIEPLILIPFIENCIKHGSFNSSDAPIRIRLHTTDHKLHFECRNKYIEQVKDRSHGIGISNVKKRLQLKYPDKHELVINDQGDHFEIKLDLIA